MEWLKFHPFMFDGIHDTTINKFHCSKRVKYHKHFVCDERKTILSHTPQLNDGFLKMFHVPSSHVNEVTLETA